MEEYYETQITLLNLQGLCRNKICKRINKSTTYVWKKIKKLGLTPNNYNRNPTLEKLIHCYYKHGFKSYEIAKILKISTNLVGDVLKNKFQIKIKQIPSNLNYFSKIDSHEKAYFVGLIAADGAIVTSRNRCDLTIGLQEEDGYILKRLSSVIGYTGRELIIVNKAKYNKNLPYNSKIQLRFTCGYKSLVNDLKRLGIVERKSKILTNILENIPKEYRKSLILGYFDGDGSISTIKPKIKSYISSFTGIKRYKNVTKTSGLISFRGTKEFLIGICNEMSWDTKYVRKYDSTYSINIGKKQHLKEFFAIYKDNQSFLVRKYNKFIQIFSQEQTIS